MRSISSAEVMQHLRVCYVVPSLKPGTGWGRTIQGLLHALPASVEPIILAPTSDRVYITDQPAVPAEFYFVCPDTFKLFQGRSGIIHLAQFVRYLAKIPQSLALDLVHAWDGYPWGLWGYVISRRFKVPLVVTLHGTYAVLAYAKLIDRQVYGHVLKYADMLCPISNGTATELKRYFGGSIRQDRLRVIPWGMDTARFSRFSPEVSYSRRNGNVIISVGSLKPRKGFDVTIRAFASVKEQLPDSKYVIVGSGLGTDYHDELVQLATELGVVSDIRFVGKVSDEELVSYLNEADVFVLTPKRKGYYFEGFGLVYIEAGACGLPVIGSRTGGVPDAILDGETGILVDEENVEQTAKALIKLLMDQELARKYGEAGRRWASKRSWTRFVTDQVRLYQEILKDNA